MEICYSGESDTGSIYVDSIDNFKGSVKKCNKSSELMYFPAVYINNPRILMRNDDSCEDKTPELFIKLCQITKFVTL